MSTHNDHIQDDREGQDHSSDANTEMQKTVTQAAKNRLIIVILIGLLGAIVGMIGHHFFQSYLNGRPADAQFWTKNASNAFSQVVALFLGLVASAVLTQAVRQNDVSLDFTHASQGMEGIDYGLYTDKGHRHPLFSS